MCLDSVWVRKGWGDSHVVIPESVISSSPLLFRICRYLLSYHPKAFEFEHLRVCAHACRGQRSTFRIILFRCSPPYFLIPGLTGQGLTLLAMLGGQ